MIFLFYTKLALETSIKVFIDIKMSSFCHGHKSSKVSILLIFPINQMHAPPFYQVVNLNFRNTQSEIDDRRTKNATVCKLVRIKSVTAKKLKNYPRLVANWRNVDYPSAVMTWGQFIGRNYYVSGTRLCTL